MNFKIYNDFLFQIICLIYFIYCVYLLSMFFYEKNKIGTQKFSKFGLKNNLKTIIFSLNLMLIFLLNCVYDLYTVLNVVSIWWFWGGVLAFLPKETLFRLTWVSLIIIFILLFLKSFRMNPLLLFLLLFYFYFLAEKFSFFITLKSVFKETKEEDCSVPSKFLFTNFFMAIRILGLISVCFFIFFPPTWFNIENLEFITCFKLSALTFLSFSNVLNLIDYWDD